ncbi:MAG: amidohydrolase [Ignavibacteria bacterium]|nr:amidohydrolase [Ignavibacteria bacterium]
MKTISAILVALLLLLNGNATFAQDTQDDGSLFYDSHLHLTNYIQKGPSIRDFMKVMGDKVGRSTLFGIPLQQQWSWMNSGEDAPKYYLDSDAPLYYYSFTDAYIAEQFNELTEDEKKRFEPMITGFNPADMYAFDHIKRVLLTFPGVFSGIGEFTIHKEFVSSKVAGEVASLRNPALDTVFSTAGEIGLVVILHNDINKPYPKTYTQNYLKDVWDLFRRHPETTIIWAHCGLGRVVAPVKDQVVFMEDMLDDPSLSHVHFDISWDEVAKYIVSSDEAVKKVAELMNRHPDRFLFGTDEVGPTDQEKYMKVYNMYEPLWKALTPETSEKVRKGNFARLFDEAKPKIRAWEEANKGKLF